MDTPNTKPCVDVSLEMDVERFREEKKRKKIDEESDCEDLATNILIPRKKTSPSLVFVDKSQTHPSILLIPSIILEVSKFLDVNDVLNLRCCSSSMNHLIDASFRELRLLLDQLQRIYNGTSHPLPESLNYGLQHPFTDRTSEMLNSLYHQLTAEQHYSKLRSNFSMMESQPNLSTETLFTFLIETGCSNPTGTHMNKLRTIIDQQLEVTRFVCAEIKAPQLRLQGTNPFTLRAISIDSAVQLRNIENQVVFFNLVYSYGYQTEPKNAFEEICTIVASTNSTDAQQLLNLPSVDAKVVAQYGSMTATGETNLLSAAPLCYDDKFFAKVAAWMGLSLKGYKMVNFLLWCLMGNKIRSYNPLIQTKPLHLDTTVAQRDNTPVEQWIRSNRYWSPSSLRWARHVLHRAYCNRFFGDILSFDVLEPRWNIIGKENIKILSNRYLNLFAGNESCQNHSAEIMITTTQGKLIIGVYYYGMGSEKPKPIGKLFLTAESHELSAIFGIPFKTQTDIANRDWKGLCAQLAPYMHGFEQSKATEEISHFQKLFKIAVASCQVISMSETGLLSANLDGLDKNNMAIFWETQLAEATLQCLSN